MVFSRCWNPEKVGFKEERMSFDVESKGKQREQAYSFHALYISWQQRVWPRLKVDLPTSKDPD